MEAEAGVKAPATGADSSTCAAGEDAVAPAPTAVFKRPKMIKNPNAGARNLREHLPFLFRNLTPHVQRKSSVLTLLADTSFLPDKAREELAEVATPRCYI